MWAASVMVVHALSALVVPLTFCHRILRHMGVKEICTVEFALLPCRYNRDAVQELAESCRRMVDMSDNAARPK